MAQPTTDTKSMVSLPALLRKNAASFGSKAAFREKEFGIWQTWSWAKALDEAEKRHTEKNTNYRKMPIEKKGRGGLEPTRYGDWEVKGIASDF